MRSNRLGKHIYALTKRIAILRTHIVENCVCLSFDLGKDFVEGENSYHVFNAIRARKATDEEKTTSARWLKLLGNLDAIAVDTHEEAVEKPAASAAENASANYSAPHPADGGRQF